MEAVDERDTKRGRKKRFKIPENTRYISRGI